MNIISNSTYWDIPEGNVHKVIDSNNNTIFEDTIDYHYRFFSIRRWIGTDNLKVKITTNLHTNITFYYWFDDDTEHPPVESQRSITVNYSTDYIDMSGHEIVCISREGGISSSNGYTTISCVYADDTSTQAPFSANGAISCLTRGDPQHGAIPEQYEFLKLFNSSRIVSARNLILYENDSVSNYCYQQMFLNCNELIHAPLKLEATTLATSCYEGMFAGCTSLKYAPVISSNTGGTPTTANSCCKQMFTSCSQLKYIKCYLDYTNSNSEFDYWVLSVPTSNDGIFATPNPLLWVRGSSGIPNNWQIIDL